VKPEYLTKQLYQQADTFLNGGRLPEARDSLQKAVKLDPEHTEAWVMLAGIQARLQNHAEAESCSRMALQQDSTIAEAHMSLGNALSALGDIKGAAASYQATIQLKPDLQIAWFRLGAVKLQMKDFVGAKKSLRKALELNPYDLHAKVYMARILAEQGQFEYAIQLLQEALVAQPETEDAWKGLALIYTKLDKLEEWLGFCQQLTMKHPASGQAWLYRGYVLERKQENELALDCYQKAIDLMPYLHDAWSRKGVVCAALERYNEAQESFREALARGSDAPITHCGYGRMLQLKGLFSEGEKHCRIAVNKEPERPLWHCELGRVLMDQGCLDEAADVFQYALKLDPYNKDGAAGLAQVYEREARHEDAYAVIKPFLDSDNTDTQIVVTLGKICTPLGKQEEALYRIEAMLKEGKLTTLQRVDLHFKSAEIYDKHNNYAKAIDHFNQANALKPVDFNPQMHTQFIDGLIDFFSEEAMAKLPQANIQCERLVFIVGMPRSGTSLAEQILACHDGVYGAGELAEVGDIAWNLGFRSDVQISPERQLRTASQERLNTISASYLTKLDTLSSGEERVIDKMPGNLLWLGLIQLLFPGAHIIHMRRDPLDTCLSCYFTHFGGVHQYAYNLENLGHYYCEHERLMAHWRNVLSVKLLEVDYEALVTNTEHVSRTILEFCGLNWDPKVLNFHESERVVNTMSYAQVRKPIYSSSIGRWKKYTEFLGPLRSALTGCSQQ